MTPQQVNYAFKKCTRPLSSQQVKRADKFRLEFARAGVVLVAMSLRMWCALTKKLKYDFFMMGKRLIITLFPTPVFLIINAYQPHLEKELSKRD